MAAPRGEDPNAEKRGTERRVFLVKPGDAIVFGNLGKFDAEVLQRLADAVKEVLGVGQVILFESDIDMDVLDG